jgi:hypothetical protein
VFDGHCTFMSVALLAAALLLAPLLLTPAFGKTLATSSDLSVRAMALACGLAVVALGFHSLWPSLLTLFALAALPGLLLSLVCVASPGLVRRSSGLRHYLAWCGLTGVVGVASLYVWSYAQGHFQ